MRQWPRDAQQSAWKAHSNGGLLFCTCVHPTGVYSTSLPLRLRHKRRKSQIGKSWSVGPALTNFTPKRVGHTVKRNGKRWSTSSNRYALKIQITPTQKNS